MDTVPVKKTVNRVKASLDKRKGPARKAQDAAPIADAIRDYWDRGMLTFGIPAHNGGAAAPIAAAIRAYWDRGMLTFGIRGHNGGRGPAPDIASLIGLQAVRCDLPMSHGVDTRDRSWQVQTTAQELFAEAVGAKQVLF